MGKFLAGKVNSGDLMTFMDIYGLFELGDERYERENQEDCRSKSGRVGWAAMDPCDFLG